jgi:hypothetical protein
MAVYVNACIKTPVSHHTESAAKKRPKTSRATDMSLMKNQVSFFMEEDNPYVIKSDELAECLEDSRRMYTPKVRRQIAELQGGVKCPVA